MTDAQNAEKRAAERKEAYSLTIHARTQSSSSCSFCGLVLTVYPRLEGMTGADATTYRLHLRRAHGLRDEIQA
jgi:hypothetical protein